MTPRRFVALANPGLTELITRKIGESWLKDLNQLRDLEPFADDAQFQQKPESANVISRSVLLGIVPVLIPAPPTSCSFPTSATRLPKNPRGSRSANAGRPATDHYDIEVLSHSHAPLRPVEAELMAVTLWAQSPAFNS